MNGSIGADFVANHAEDPAVRRRRMDRQARNERLRQAGVEAEKLAREAMTYAPASALRIATQDAARKATAFYEALRSQHQLLNKE